MHSFVLKKYHNKSHNSWWLKEKVINHEIEEIQWRIQKIAVMDDSQKTEEVRNQEQVNRQYPNLFYW